MHEFLFASNEELDRKKAIIFIVDNINSLKIHEGFWFRENTKEQAMVFQLQLDASKSVKKRSAHSNKLTSVSCFQCLLSCNHSLLD